MRKAQQLVEFAFVLPIVLAILLVIIELGFAINARITLAEAVKMSVAQVNQLYDLSDNATTKQTDIQNSLTNSMQNYFSNHNLPYSNNITVKLIPGTNGSQTSIVVANYTYYPVFLLPNFFGITIIPTSIPMSSFQIVNNNLLLANNYPSKVLGVDNSGATSTNAISMFTNDSTDTLPQTSILKGDSDNGGSIDGIPIGTTSSSYTTNARTVKSFVAFLLKFTPTGTFVNSSSDTYVRLFNWWGEDLLPINEVFDLTTGHIEVKSPYYQSGKWFDTNIPYNWVLTSLGFTQAVYTQYDTNPTFPTSKLNLATSGLNPGVPWCDLGANNGTCSGDISTSDVNNLNKRGLSFLFASSGGASGTYDTINDTTSTYNQIYNYSFMNSTYNYLLRLFIPNSASPVDSQNGFQAQLSLDSNGVYTAGTSYYMMDVYIDSSGGGIPDAWNNVLPAGYGYFDADADGTFDGQQTSSIIARYPSSAQSSCGGGTPLSIATPYLLNGSLNSSGNNFVPSTFPLASSGLNYMKCTTTFSETNYTSALYLSNGTNTIRNFNVANSSIKANFINGTLSGSTLKLNNSPELTSTVGIFSTTNKATHS